MIRLRNALRASTLSRKVYLDSFNKRYCKEGVKIVIIGAGLAGLSAASHLMKNGFTNTILLEATTRYGGRINTQQFGDVFCELGAKWISLNAKEGSMYELLHKATGLHKRIEPKGEMVYVGPRGNHINQKLPQIVNLLFKNICSNIKIEEKCKESNVHHLNNVQTYFQAEAANVVKVLFKKKQQPLVQEIFDSMFKEYGSLIGCCLEYLNIEHITKMKSTSIDPVYIPTGLDNLLGYIANDIYEDNLLTGKPVGEISWFNAANPNERIVNCLDGNSFLADHIICTLPLGVLKNFSNQMFKPNLPKSKQNAIKNLGVGSPVKIYLEYFENIRPWFHSVLRPLWRSELQKKKRTWLYSIVEVSKVPISNRVVEIMVGGGYYDEIEKMSDVNLVSDVTDLLRTCLRNPDVPYPRSILRSDWSSSACYLGGRPYFSTTSSSNDVTALAAPLGSNMPLLLFAGDATSLNGFGTMDGARMSGIREAQRIIDYYDGLENKKSQKPVIWPGQSQFCA